MENDETTLDPIEENNQDGETVEVEETSTEEVADSAETPETPAPAVKLTYEQKLAQATTPEEKFAIADAEANKNRRLLNKKPQTEKPVTPQASSLSVEETVLLAQGMPEELVTKLKSVAKVQGISSLIKAQNDPVFIAVKEKFEKDEKQKASSMPAARGAGAVKPKVSFTTPGLTREQHREMVLRG